MDIRLYNSDVQEIAIVDNYISLVWTDRYNECGDFTLDLEPSEANLKLFAIGNYLRIKYSRHIMLLETVNLRKREDGTSYLTVSGRSVECILEKRLYIPIRKEGEELPEAFIEMRDTLAQTVAPGIGETTTYYFAAASDAIDQVMDIANDGKSYGTLADVTDCYSEVTDICARKHIGFEFLYDENAVKDDKGNTPFFKYHFYKGKNRTIEEDREHPLILSYRYDTLSSSEFVKSIKDRITHVCAYKLINFSSSSGSSQTAQLMYVYHVPGTPDKGPYRFDTLLDLSSKADKDKDGKDIPYISGNKLASNANELFAQYAEAEAKKSVAKSNITELYSGEIEPKISGLVYIDNYYLGDVVEFDNGYNAYSQCRITEVIISSDETGETIYPTFSSLVDEIDTE